MIAKTRLAPYLALIPVCAGVFVAADDQTVIVTVLPRVMLDMEIPPYELDYASWTVTGYLLGYVAAMPLMGKLSDVFGHRRLFVYSMLLFMAASAAVALMPSIGWLIAARIVQAVGAGALVPISIAIVGDLFPPGGRGVPMGLIGAAAEAGGVIGPLWGGLFVRFLDWRWVFWVNLPLGAVVIIALLIMVRPSPRYPARVDYVGGGLVALGLAALTLGLARADSPGPAMAGFMALAVLATGLFVLRLKSVSDPLIPLSMFTARPFSAASTTHLFVGGGLIIGMVTIPLMANTVLGQTPLEGGLRLMRMTAAIPVGAVLGGLACQRWDYRVPAIAGLVLAAAGFLLMSGWGADVADPGMTVHLVTGGLGFGLLIAPVALAATNSVPVELRGTAASTVTAARMIGMTAGLAALAAWGVDRFQTLTEGAQLPLARVGETAVELEQRQAEFTAAVSQAGLTLFSNFFEIAMALCLIGLAPAALMAWRKARGM